MAPGIYLLSLGMFFGTIVIVFAIRYVSLAFAARARIAGDTAYRALAEKALAVQAESQAALSAMQAELERISASLAAVQTILKQVE